MRNAAEYVPLVLFSIFVVGFLFFDSRRLHTDVLYLFMLAATFVFLRKSVGTFDSRPFLAYAAFLSFLTLSYIWSPVAVDVYDAVRRVLILFFYVFSVFLVFSLGKSAIFKCYCMLTPPFLAAAGLMIWGLWPDIGSARINNPYFYDGSNPIRSVSPFVFYFSISLSVLLFSHSKKSVIFSCLSIFSCVVIFILSGSRGFLLSSLLAVIFCSSLFFRKRTVFALIAILLLSVIALDLVFHELRFFSRLDNMRFSIWAASIDLWLAAPLVGHGVGGPLEVTVDGRSYVSPHNIFLAILIKSGLIGLFLFVVFLGVTALNVMRTEGRRERAVAGTFAISALTPVLFDSHEIFGRFDPVLWMTFFSCVAVCLSFSSSGFFPGRWIRKETV